MGKRSRVSETSSLIIYYILIINTCCDISLINCDIHEMRQQHVNRLANSVEINANEIDFKIDPIELQAHIMTGLNMTKTPDAELVSAKNPPKNKYLRERNFFHVPSWSSRHKARWMQMSLFVAYLENLSSGRTEKNSCCAKLAINQSSGLFCSHWNDILRWSRRDWRLCITQQDWRGFPSSGTSDGGICFSNIWKSCKCRANGWAGLDFLRRKPYLSQKPFNVPLKLPKICKEIRSNLPTHYGLRAAFNK